MNVYTMTVEEFEQELTNVKNILSIYLMENDYIDKKQCEHLMLNIGIIIKKPSYFSTSWNKYIKKINIDKVAYIIVEQKSIEKENIKE